MKKRMTSMLAAVLVCLSLTSMVAGAAEWYEVKPFYVQYLGCSNPCSGEKEMTVNGKTVTVLLYPAGSKFKAFRPLSISDVYCYTSSGELVSNIWWDSDESSLPATGIYNMFIYSERYGPEGDIWVSADGSGTAAKPEKPAEPGKTAFTDVKADMYYAEPVAWAVKQGITDGTSDTTFSPDKTCTRGQIITFLWRAAGSPEPKNAVLLGDVNPDMYYAKAVAWAAENGMAEGSAFHADNPCTREMAVDFMWKHAGKPGAAAANFADISSAAVNWAVEAGVTQGTSDTEFSPALTCTRGQIVTFLHRSFAK
ncbi:S-layer homology domain-containing protein [Agathobaculum desmolans]|uniref:S-layer homology domain-containing protein n=1 Tax=Agathobaculum desmolans TaxID=39484 RepID=UPI000691710E|nr:S-layer homology domain-containing protein [Agathobaculum desmolans]